MIICTAIGANQQKLHNKVWANYIPWMIRFLEFPPFWQTYMPLVLSTYIRMCKQIMTRKNTKNNRYPFHPPKLDKILSTVLANKEILYVVHGQVQLWLGQRSSFWPLKSSFPLPKSRFLLLYYSYSRILQEVRGRGGREATTGNLKILLCIVAAATAADIRVGLKSFPPPGDPQGVAGGWRHNTTLSHTTTPPHFWAGGFLGDSQRISGAKSIFAPTLPL